MPHSFALGGRTVATAATANHVAAQLWNPHATIPIFVRQFWVCSTTATASNLAINRSNVRGATPTSTVTPDIDSDMDAYVTPTTASVLELATFTTQPTLDAPAMYRWNLPGVIGAGFIFVFDPPIKVAPGNATACVCTHRLRRSFPLRTSPSSGMSSAQGPPRKAHILSRRSEAPDTAGAINDCLCALWNPASPPIPIYFVAFLSGWHRFGVSRRVCLSTDHDTRHSGNNGDP